MVVKYSPRGLIATTRSRTSPPLEDLVGWCGWPLVLGANPRQMQRELSLHNPECVLFWVDEQRAIKSTAQLITWSRQRGARPYRVAVAYRMSSDVEPVLRAAGAHSFLPLAGSSGALVATALDHLLEESVRAKNFVAIKSSIAPLGDEQVATIEMSVESVRPP